MIKIFTLLSLCIIADCLNGPEVKINQGVLRGKYRKTWKGRQFASFTGIPYAKPPINDLRFELPVPAEPWESTLDATEYSAFCPQMSIFENNFIPKGDEDCLYLNVYTPNNSTSTQEVGPINTFESILAKIKSLFRKLLQQNDSKPKLLPVMVYIHGGGYRTDSGDSTMYGPDLLIDYDVVLVTINYRLGFLGFASTGSEVLPGNLGLKDQNLALKWIKENIVKFGGDPNRVVIFGQSAGGASTHLHTLSPLSKGLFHGAIAQSGISFASWSLIQNQVTINNTKKIAKWLNCSEELDQEMVKCFKTFDALDLIQTENKFSEWDKYPIILFRPVIEPNLPGAFLTKHPIDIIKSGKLAEVPFMTGFTADDGAMLSADLYKDDNQIQDLNNNFNKILPIILEYNESDYKASDEIRKFYFNGGNISSSTKSHMTELFTDSLFAAPANLAVQLHSKHSKQPVYYYKFAYRGTESFTSIFGDTEFDYGVCHCDELLYLLSNEIFENYRPYEHESIIDVMLRLWTNFATYGNPTPFLNEIIHEKWEPVGSDLQYYLIKSSDELGMAKNEFIQRSAFWNNLSLFDDTSNKIRDEL